MAYTSCVGSTSGEGLWVIADIDRYFVHGMSTSVPVPSSRYAFVQLCFQVVSVFKAALDKDRRLRLRLPDFKKLLLDPDLWSMACHGVSWRVMARNDTPWTCYGMSWHAMARVMTATRNRRCW